jgi:hypothetical protein
LSFEKKKNYFLREEEEGAGSWKTAPCGGGVMK